MLKVIDQGADDTTNAVSIRAFFAPHRRRAHDHAHHRGDHHPDPPPHSGKPLPDDQILVYQVPQPEPLYRLEPSRAETAAARAGRIWRDACELYEDIARFGRVADSLRLSGDGQRALSDVALADSGVRQSEDAPHAGAATVRRRARKAHLRHAALTRRALAGFRGSSVPCRTRAALLRAVRQPTQLSRRNHHRRSRRRDVRLLGHRLLRSATGAA